MSKQVVQALIVPVLLLFMNACSVRPAMQQFGPSLVDGTTQYARVVQERTDAPPLLSYERSDGDPVPALAYANELIVGAQDFIKQPARPVLEKALHGSDIPLQIVREIPGRNLFLVRATGHDLVAPGSIAGQLQRSLPPGFRFEPNIAFTAYANQDLLGTRVQEQWALRNIGEFPDSVGGTPDADTDGYEALVKLKYMTPPPKVRPVVAVQDTGLDVEHPALKSSVWINAGETPGNKIDDDGNGYVDDVQGWDFLSDWHPVPDFNGHGTHVAGIIASSPPDPTQPHVAFGLAPAALIMPLRILTGSEREEEEENELYAPLFSTLEAHAYARNKGANIINMSYGSYVPSEFLAEEIKENHRKGIHQVAAAGNGRPKGHGVDLNQHPVYPCVLPHVICVASTGPRDTLSTFSNFGVRAQEPGWAAIAAPGEHIFSTWPGGRYEWSSGTSMSTPMVAAVLASAMVLYPEESNQDRLLRVLGAADRLDSLDLKVHERRRLNAYQALFEQKPTGISVHDRSPYCEAWITDRESGQPIQRWRNRPYANWGEPGIDGSSAKKQFMICTADQLMMIRDEDMDKSFGLAQDIHWSLLGPVGAYPIGGQPRAPGEPPLRFEGRFTGHDHAIIGMRFAGGNIGGLFAHLGGRALIRHLRLRGVDIKASDAAGALAARMDSGLVFNVHADGVVNGGRTAGGMVGELRGGVLNAPFFEGHVISESFAGGIAGHVRPIVPKEPPSFTQAYFNGTVEAATAGGLVGHANRESWISGHALGVIRGDMAGGIAGKLSCGALVRNSYANGYIYSDHSEDQAGGIAGRLSNAHIRDGYSSVFFEKPGKTRGGAVGVHADGEQVFPPGHYVCTGSAQAPKPSQLLRVFYDSNSAPAAGGGEPRTPEQLRDARTYPPQWHDPNFGTWVFRPGFMATLDDLPRFYNLNKRPLQDESPNPADYTLEAYEKMMSD